MVFDSALADAEISGDLLAGMASEDQVHDLALSRTQPRDVVGRVLPPGRQLVDQLVPFMKQSLYSGESLLQPDSRQLAFTPRDRAAVRAFKYDVWRRVRTVRRMFNGHASALRPVVRIRCLGSEDGRSLPRRQPRRIDPDQMCPIPDIELAARILSMPRNSCRAKPREMSDTRRRPCLDRQKGAASPGDRSWAPATNAATEIRKVLAEDEAKQEQQVPARKRNGRGPAWQP
jgi:hypothetical protein